MDDDHILLAKRLMEHEETLRDALQQFTALKHQMEHAEFTLHIEFNKVRRLLADLETSMSTHINSDWVNAWLENNDPTFGVDNEPQDFLRLVDDSD